MDIIGIIPARMNSTRFPGKPLAKIRGRAMIYHVYRRSKMAKILGDVYIATCDKEIKNYCLKNGMNVIMTKDTHQRASDRTREAAEKIEKKNGKKIDIIVMIQGDEPLVCPEMIEESVGPILEDPAINVTNLMAPLKSDKEHEDFNEIKVVIDTQNFALYFSRQPIPTKKENIFGIPVYKQVCIIPFRRDFLFKFSSFEPTPLEIAESIDMLRILEHGYRVKMVLTGFESQSVDNRNDLTKVEKLMKKDPLVKKYVN